MMLNGFIFLIILVSYFDYTLLSWSFFFFFFNDTATTEIYTLSLHDALPIWESGRAARQGVSELLKLMAMIGVNLAILNLLPIPPLDGGHILLLFIEGSIRRDLKIGRAHV